jgi:hypothetical protein
LTRDHFSYSSDGLFVSERPKSQPPVTPRRIGPFLLSSDSSDADDDRSSKKAAQSLAQRVTRQRSTRSSVKPEEPQNPLLKRDRELSTRHAGLKGIKTVRDGRISKHHNQAEFHEGVSRSLTRQADLILAQAKTMMAEALDHDQKAKIHRDAVEEQQADETLVDEKPLEKPDGEVQQSSSSGLVEDDSAKIHYAMDVESDVSHGKGKRKKLEDADDPQSISRKKGSSSPPAGG